MKADPAMHAVGFNFFSARAFSRLPPVLAFLHSRGQDAAQSVVSHGAHQGDGHTPAAPSPDCVSHGCAGTVDRHAAWPAIRSVSREPTEASRRGPQAGPQLRGPAVPQVALGLYTRRP